MPHQESTCPTFMLTHYARDRTHATGRTTVPIQEAVKWQTKVK